MRIGYARVSTQEQNLDLQKDALKRAGCEKIIEDVISGKAENRSGLDRAREQLREGDVLVVWRLDRLGRSLKHLIELMAELEKQKIGFLRNMFCYPCSQFLHMLNRIEEHIFGHGGENRSGIPSNALG